MSDKFDFESFDDGKADQLLRQTMADHRVEPSKGLWQGISRKLLWNELLHFNFTNLSPKLWIAASAGLLLIATTFYLVSKGSSDEPRAIQVNPVKPASLVAMTPVVSPAGTDNITGNGNGPGKSTGTDSPGSESASQVSVVNQRQFAFIPNPGNRSGIQLLNKTGPGDDPSDDLIELVPLNDAPRATSIITRLHPVGATWPGLSSGTDTIITISNQAGIVKYRKNGPEATRFFSAELGITPEIAFYSDPGEYSKANFWLNGGVMYHLSRFSLATGFGLGYVYDEGKYLVEYKTRDSVGYFTGVTSYTVGANNELLYNTHSVTVYDSLQHDLDYRTKNRYSYLQVPLLLGYRIFESNKISMVLQAGPAFSVLLGSRKSDPVIEYENATIIRVDDATPSRNPTNWQIWATLYFEMRMNKQISIYLEPSFKYYLKPVVSQENNDFKAPFTVGMGVGIQFNFGQKTNSP